MVTSVVPSIVVPASMVIVIGFVVSLNLIVARPIIKPSLLIRIKFTTVVILILIDFALQKSEGIILDLFKHIFLSALFFDLILDDLNVALIGIKILIILHVVLIPIPHAWLTLLVLLLNRLLLLGCLSDLRLLILVLNLRQQVFGLLQVLHVLEGLLLVLLVLVLEDLLSCFLVVVQHALGLLRILNIRQGRLRIDLGRHRGSRCEVLCCLSHEVLLELRLLA